MPLPRIRRSYPFLHRLIDAFLRRSLTLKRFFRAGTVAIGPELAQLGELVAVAGGGFEFQILRRLFHEFLAVLHTGVDLLIRKLALFILAAIGSRLLFDLRKINKIFDPLWTVWGMM